MALGYEIAGFIDDDEIPSPGWWTNLLTGITYWEGDIATGPAIAVLPTDSSPGKLLRLAFEVPRYETGNELPTAASNNVAFRVGRVGNLRFNEDYSATGGEDTLFFEQLTRAGAQIVWIDEAVVLDMLPHDRVSWIWLFKRWHRIGSVSARIARERDDIGRLQIALGALARLTFGLVCLPTLPLRRRSSVLALQRIARGSGMVRYLASGPVQGYRASNAVSVKPEQG